MDASNQDLDRNQSKRRVPSGIRYFRNIRRGEHCSSVQLNLRNSPKSNSNTGKHLRRTANGRPYIVLYRRRVKDVAPYGIYGSLHQSPVYVISSGTKWGREICCTIVRLEDSSIPLRSTRNDKFSGRTKPSPLGDGFLFYFSNLEYPLPNWTQRETRLRVAEEISAWDMT